MAWKKKKKKNVVLANMYFITRQESMIGFTEFFHPASWESQANLSSYKSIYLKMKHTEKITQNRLGEMLCKHDDHTSHPHNPREEILSCQRWGSRSRISPGTCQQVSLPSLWALGQWKICLQWRWEELRKIPNIDLWPLCEHTAHTHTYQDG